MLPDKTTEYSYILHKKGIGMQMGFIFLHWNPAKKRESTNCAKNPLSLNEQYVK